MHVFVINFFLIVFALWVYRLLSYFFGKDESKASKASYRRR
ncbi:hypothetical protein LX64_02096 [Chitinophaga skermanii]|uniref:Uncharacterized protein n=1 Tax=Chitinophaga skermanii TaxID=331697 RepID=A0A327QSP3_9BACT|nr:hypothetical protein [Chitinophaga skermanii]RAJ06968.1 hypothetical protein LX64_02096 [Chitinophaga skermanii]